MLDIANIVGKAHVLLGRLTRRRSRLVVIFVVASRRCYIDIVAFLVDLEQAGDQMLLGFVARISTVGRVPQSFVMFAR